VYSPSQDLCYFLGLITGRGRLYEDENNCRVIIEFAHKNEIQTGIPFCPNCNSITSNDKCKKCNKKITPKYKIKFDQRDEVLKSINEVVSPLIRKIVGKVPEITGTSVYTYLSVDFNENKDLFKWIAEQFKPYNSFHKFEIPKIIHSFDKEYKIEYMKGIADTAGFPVWGNWHQSGLARTYIQIINANWKLPVQICNLLQDELDIPIQTIDWGHPNIRDGNMIEYKEGKESAAFREHQVKIFADDFKIISHKFNHKKQLFDELAKHNESIGGSKQSLCDPPKPIMDNQFRVKHDAENSVKIPNELRGNHFDAFWQICWKMGCNRCFEFAKSAKNRDGSFLTGRKDFSLNLDTEKTRIEKLKIQKIKELKPIWAVPAKHPSKPLKNTSSHRLKEEDTYEPQRKWLQKYLEKKFPNSTIETFVVADTDMDNYFSRYGLERHAEIAEDFDIRPDIVGFVDRKKIVFIESKITTLGIKEIGQLLGYCLIANPEIAILCSTKNSSGSLAKILPHDDLIIYGNGLKIKFAEWDQKKDSMKFLN